MLLYRCRSPKSSFNSLVIFSSLDLNNSRYCVVEICIFAI